MEDADMGIVIAVFVAVALIVDDLYRPVVSRRILVAGPCGARARRREEQQSETHQDREIARCLAHTRLRVSFQNSEPVRGHSRTFPWHTGEQGPLHARNEQTPIGSRLDDGHHAIAQISSRHAEQSAPTFGGSPLRSSTE